MSTWMVWIAICAGIALLAVLGALLYRLMAKDAAADRAAEQTGNRFVPTTPDETMVISREQADEMLRK